MQVQYESFAVKMEWRYKFWSVNVREYYNYVHTNRHIIFNAYRELYVTQNKTCYVISR